MKVFKSTRGAGSSKTKNSSLPRRAVSGDLPKKRKPNPISGLDKNLSFRNFQKQVLKTEPSEKLPEPQLTNGPNVPRRSFKLRHAGAVDKSARNTGVFP
jgi:hypothetical protein